MTTRTTIYFETQTCSRCGGTGRMPYSAYGGVCFKCNGQTKTFTRAGLAARKAFFAARAAACETASVTGLTAGQKVSFDGGERWRTVVADVDPTRECGSAGIGEDKVALIRVETQKVNHLVKRTDTVLLWTPGAHEAAIEKVRKRKGVVKITEEVVTA